MTASTLRVEGGTIEGVADEAPARTTIEALFQAHVTFVWRTLRHFGVASADLDDQTQEVFLVAHRRLDEWDGEHPRAWLHAIARRRASTYRRRSHRRHERAVDAVPEESDLRDPAARTEINLLNRVLDSLDEEKRSIFVLYEVEQLSMREVAIAMNVTLTTAYARLYAVRRELARVLGTEEAT